MQRPYNPCFFELSHCLIVELPSMADATHCVSTPAIFTTRIGTLSHWHIAALNYLPNNETLCHRSIAARVDAVVHIVFQHKVVAVFEGVGGGW